MSTDPVLGFSDDERRILTTLLHAEKCSIDGSMRALREQGKGHAPGFMAFIKGYRRKVKRLLKKIE